MIFVSCAVILLCLVSVGHSSSLACEELVRPLNQLDLHRLEGTWAMVAGSLTPALPQSASVKFFSNTSDSNISYTLSIRSDGKCRHTSFNITLEGSSFTFDGTDKSNLSASFVHTSCRDCMLMSTSYNSGQRRHLYLLSKRRQVEEAEMEEFRAQAKCLNLSPPGVMDPTEDLCPEQKTSDPNNQAEKKAETQD